MKKEALFFLFPCIAFVQGRCHHDYTHCNWPCCTVSVYCNGDVFGTSCDADMYLPDPSDQFACVDGDCDNVNIEDNTMHCEATALSLYNYVTATMCKITPAPTVSPTPSPTAAPTLPATVPTQVIRETLTEKCYEGVDDPDGTPDACLADVDSIMSILWDSAIPKQECDCSPPDEGDDEALPTVTFAKAGLNEIGGTDYLKSSSRTIVGTLLYSVSLVVVGVGVIYIFVFAVVWSNGRLRRGYQRVREATSQTSSQEECISLVSTATTENDGNGKK